MLNTANNQNDSTVFANPSIWESSADSYRIIRIDYPNTNFKSKFEMLAPYTCRGVGNFPYSGEVLFEGSKEEAIQFWLDLETKKKASEAAEKAAKREAMIKAAKPWAIYAAGAVAGALDMYGLLKKLGKLK